MKSLKLKFINPHYCIGTLALLLLTSPALGQNTIRFESQFPSKVRIDGTSTIHDWNVESKIIGGYIEFDSALLANASKPPAEKAKFTPKLEVNIPVTTLKCSSGKPMDVVMYRALNQTQHPQIKFSLSELVVTKAPADAKSPAEFEAKGDLTVAGNTRTITFPVTMARVEEDRLKFTGATKMKMTDFGISPPAPSLALGLIKTGDEITVSFEWLTARAKDTAAAAK